MKVNTSRSGTIRKRSRFLLIFLVFFSTYIISGCEKAPKSIIAPPADVTINHPAQRQVTTFLEHTGTTVGLESVEIRARFSGYLEQYALRTVCKNKEG